MLAVFLEFQGIQLTRVVSTINGTVLGASGAIRAKSSVPCVASVAVGVSANVVGPAPVGIKNDRTSLGGTAVTTSAGAGLPVELGVGLSCGGADLLGADGAQEGERGESERSVHLVC